MYPPNRDFFARNDIKTETAFPIWEVGTDSLLYAEVFYDKLLSRNQMEAFIAHCEYCINSWILYRLVEQSDGETWNVL
jgi:hypothetical protein